MNREAEEEAGVEAGSHRGPRHEYDLVSVEIILILKEEEAICRALT